VEPQASVTEKQPLLQEASNPSFLAVFRDLSSRRFAILLFLVALAIRLSAVLVMRDFHEGPNFRQATDGVIYSRLGNHLALGEGYIEEAGVPTAFRPPGFPLLLAGIYALAGQYYPLVYLAFCTLGASSCLLAYALAREVLSEYFARWAGILSSVYIPHIYFSTLFYTETLFIPLLGLSLWLLVRHLKTGRPWQLASAGLALGLAALVRPAALVPFAVFALVLVANRPRDWRRISIQVAIFTMSFLGPILPWSVRNYVVLGRPVLIATEGGCTFWGGNNDLVLNEPRRYGVWAPFTVLPSLDRILAARDEIERDQIEWRLGMEWVRTHMSSMPRLLLFKFCRLLLPDLESPSKSYILIQAAGYTPFLILFVLGGFRSLWDRRSRTISWWVLHLTILATVLTALIFYGSPRFRDAVLPVLMVYASLGLATFFPSRPALAGAANPAIRGQAINPNDGTFSASGVG
jgi:4-amino-4-deoxy-L-arabinose transferase-like glycosyltransferase